MSKKLTMESNEKRNLYVSDGSVSGKKIQKDKRFHTEGKGLQSKLLSKDPKTTIFANIGKGGINLNQPYLIYDKGYNVTPKIMEDPQFPNIHTHEVSKVPAVLATQIRLGSVSLVGLKQDLRSSFSSPSVLMISTGGRSSLLSKINATPLMSKRSEITESHGNLLLDQPTYSICSIEEFEEEESYSVHKTGSLAPSMFQLRISPPSKEMKPKTTFTVNLSETETMFMLEIPSTAELLESEGGKIISQSNSLYENTLQTTKAISQTATQTDGIFKKNRTLYIPRNKRANASTFVSIWEMYDTYVALLNTSKKSFESRDGGEIILIDEDMEKAVYNIEFEFAGSLFNNRLLVALMTMERLIINNLYRERHLIYNGLLVQDPLSLEVIYNYSLTHLWTFYSEFIVKKRAVTSMSWNKADTNILAVGYGKFYYKDQCNGLVCIWNVKNPVCPERHYEFEHPVTSISFNPKRTQILAVTFYNGSVFLIDIISWVLLVKATNEHYPLYHPVWKAKWFSSESKGYKNQVLITCGKNGMVYRYKKDKFFISKKIMAIGKVHGRIHGVELPKPCYSKKNLTSTSVQVLVPHPVDTLVYLVGTSDGCVFICSILSRYQHLEVFQAHTGPIYNIQFNPFCEKVFLTCGADWCIRVWMEGVHDPLITLHSGMQPVEDAVWSPLHSTVIISITDRRVEIWDIRRSTSTPKSSITTPSASFNTSLDFTTNRYNMCVGDIEGNVHVMGMTEMPFSPNYQEEVLLEALMGTLVTNPELLNKLIKLYRPFSKSGASLFQTKMNHKLCKLVAYVKEVQE